MQEANNAEEKKKGNRLVDTEERINRMNELHAHTRDYNTAAEYVFYDSPAKRERYRPPVKPSNIDIDDELSQESGYIVDQQNPTDMEG